MPRPAQRATCRRFCTRFAHDEEAGSTVPRPGARAGQRALGMAVRISASDATLVDEGLHEGVVFGDPACQFAIAQHVGAGVADVRHPDPSGGE